MLRPRLGHGSDVGGRRTPWILGGMAVLAAGGVLAAVATAAMEGSLALGIALAVLAFLLIGVGVGAAGTSLLVLLASRTAPERKAAAASVVWIMMIAGFVVTTAVAGRLLDPYSPERLVTVAAGVSAIALALATLGVWGMEPRAPAQAAPRPARPDFRAALAAAWADRQARRFTVFVFVSMLAYSAQDLVLEPFAGAVFGMTLGESTQLSSLQHAGVLVGMVLIAILGGRGGGGHLMRWTVGGCMGAAVCASVLAAGSLSSEGFPVQAAFLALGLANGVFAAAAIATMMHLANAGREGGEGVRMGLWGAAQAIAFGLGGLLGTVVVDAARLLLGTAPAAYAAVFVMDAALFAAAAAIASGLARVGRPGRLAQAAGAA
jgi:BCD family chlorophyll transporter-like MFS transporter